MFENLKRKRLHRKAQWEAIPQDERDRILTKEWRSFGSGLAAWTAPFGILAVVFSTMAGPLIELGNIGLGADSMQYALGYGGMASLGPAFALVGSNLVRRRHVARWHKHHAADGGKEGQKRVKAGKTA